MTQILSIKTNFDLCTGCSLCQLACSQRLLGGYNPHRALLRITHKTENLYHFPLVCNQCENPYCANVCPVKAISRNPQTGAMVVDHDTCIGCNMCRKYCPIEMVGVDPDLNKSVKCDLCNGNPACVAVCPTGALELAYRALPDKKNNEEADHG
ncbi:MAG: 4Fe-4S dicluster domain-containing protein [Desulfatibacillum sp.]|nr:4Fe-4S dicluster domain-containing protein [Desulfatibacillum sp.]